MSLNSHTDDGLLTATNGSAERQVVRKPSIAAIVVGGCQNALSVTRGLARHGVEVLTVNYPYEVVRFSRYGHYVTLEGDGSPEGWEKFLLSRESDRFKEADLH